MASVTHHLPALLSFCKVGKKKTDERGGRFGGIEEREVEDTDRKKGKGFSQNDAVLYCLD